MSRALVVLPGLLVALATAPVRSQPPPQLEGGTYNAPAGAGAYTPFAPLPPLYDPGLRFGQPAPFMPQRYWFRQIPLRTPPGRNQESKATIKVLVPNAQARLWVNGQATRKQGVARLFVTPPLEPGTYRYRIRASWVAGKKPVSEVRTITFQPDANLVVDFTREAPVTR